MNKNIIALLQLKAVSRLQQKGNFIPFSYTGKLYFINDALIIEFFEEQHSPTLHCNFYIREASAYIPLRHITGETNIIEDPISYFKKFKSEYQHDSDQVHVNHPQAIKFAYYIHLTIEHYYDIITNNDSRLTSLQQKCSPQQLKFLNKLWHNEFPSAYYRIGLSEDAQVMGAEYPLIFKVRKTHNYTEEELIFISDRENRSIPKGFNMDSFLSRSGANNVDFYSSSILSNKGLFISIKAQELLKNYRIHNGKFYSLTINQGFPQEKNLFFLEVLEANDIIDYKHSTFAITDESKEPTNIQFNNYEEYQTLFSELKEKNEAYKLQPKDIVLLKYPDLLKFPNKSSFLISETLAKALFANKLTGVEVYNSDIFIH